jgi:hypothetical protein
LYAFTPADKAKYKNNKKMSKAKFPELYSKKGSLDEKEESGYQRLKDYDDDEVFGI